MSASEGLEALEPVAVHHDLHRLIDSLPQIVAVVLAAERQYEAHHPDGGRGLPNEVHLEVRQALTALEETLR